MNNDILSSNIEFITSENININGLSNIIESNDIHYLIYRIDNIKTHKYYIGQHQTNNPYDNYMGSGCLILKALNKYEISTFIKTILFDFSSFEEMNLKEQELVQLSNCFPYDKMSYNLKEGGQCGKLSEISIQKSIKSWKNTRNAKSDIEKQQLSKKYSDGAKRMWKKPGIKEKRHKTLMNRTQKQKDDRNKKYTNTIKNRSIEKQKEISNKFSKLNAQHYIDNPNLAQEHSKRMSGKGNPMYGKNIKDFMSLEAYNEMRRKLSEKSKGRNNPAYGRKWMHLKGSNKKEDRVYVKHDQVQYYLDIGYVFGLKEK